MRLRSLLLPCLATAVAIGAAVATDDGRWWSPQPLAAEAPAAGPGSAPATGSGGDTVVARGLVDVDGGLIQIAASRDGVVRTVMVDEGARVREGDVLLTLDDRTARSDLAVAEAELVQAKSALHPIQVRREAAERDAARLQRLVAAKAAAQAQLDEAEDRVRLAAADLMLQQASIATASARRQAAAAELAERTVRAPVDGVVVRRQVRPGDGISTLNVTTLFWLAPSTPPIVRAEIEELGADAVRPGQPALVVVEDDAVRRYSATVVRVGQAFVPRRASLYDPRERTDVRVVEAIVRFDAPPPLRLGQRVIVRFPAGGAAPSS